MTFKVGDRVVRIADGQVGVVNRVTPKQLRALDSNGLSLGYTVLEPQARYVLSSPELETTLNLLAKRKALAQRALETAAEPFLKDLMAIDNARGEALGHAPSPIEHGYTYSHRPSLNWCDVGQHLTPHPIFWTQDKAYRGACEDHENNPSSA